MGNQKMHHRRNRRGRVRGFAPFVAFALLFAFALGQGSSLFAFAFDNSGAGPTVSKDGSAPTTDGSGDGGSAKVDGSGTKAVSSGGGGTSTEGAGDASTAGGGGEADGPEIAQLEGGDIDFDFVAAGPFTYDHDTGVGGEYGDRTISKTAGVVESLEGGDFKCGDLVVFFVRVAVEDGASTSDDIEIDMSLGAETTGQPGLGFTTNVTASVNTGDSANTTEAADTTASLEAPAVKDTAGYDEILFTVDVNNLDAGETVIIRIVGELDCLVGASPTGNILNAILEGRVVGDGKINVGNETVPFKKVEDVAQPGLNVLKSCPVESPFGAAITYSITVSNQGNEDLVNLTVTDTILGDLSGSFANTLTVGASETHEFQYTPKASDPDPLTNTVTAEADGEISEAHVSDTTSCTTDITHAPGIDVTKSCPAAVDVGEDIEYTITVENTGDEALVDVTVDDTLLGDITDEFDFDFSQPFPVGAVATATVTYEQQAGDPDPITNTVTATGTGADSKDEASDTATCVTDIVHQPGIDVSKTCVALAHEGDVVTYSITVTNTGNEALEDVTVTDSVLGDLSGSFSDTLAVGASETHEFEHTISATDDDPLVNLVTASGSGVDSGDTVTATATCSTDILHPAIDIVKTVSDRTVAEGDTVTYTFVVTNTGDTTLFDISVDDDVLGHIGDIDVLEPGDSATLTADFVVPLGVTDNIVVAVGRDVTGREVSASDNARVIGIGADEPPTTTTTPPPTPFTGSDAGRLGLIAVLAFGIGLTVVAATSRRRSGETA